MGVGDCTTPGPEYVPVKAEDSRLAAIGIKNICDHIPETRPDGTTQEEAEAFLLERAQRIRDMAKGEGKTELMVGAIEGAKVGS